MSPVWLPLLGRPVHPMTAIEVANLVLDSVRGNATVILGNLNLHAAYLSETHALFARYLDCSSYTIIDGWPVLAWARLSGACVGGRHRVGSSDWLRVLLDRDPALTVVAIGGTPEAARGAADAVAGRCSNLRWLGFDGYRTADALSEAGSPKLRAALSEAQVVLVGMGMPRQEQWILDHLHLLQGKVVANVGGCIDYLSGHQRESPRLLGRLGLEWLYRLVNNPRRLAHRYLLEPFALLTLMAKRFRAARRGGATQ